MDLSGRHVVITGAAGGIGSALTEACAAAGARLTLSDIGGVDDVASRFDDAVGVAADIGTETGNAALISAAREAHGPIDVFFANAGVAIGTDPMDAEEVWDVAFDVNIHAHRWAARYLLPEWLERGEGYFVATASAAGLLAQIGSAHYSVTKHAAVAFAEWLSITYGNRGLKVSCLCPQGVNTAMIHQDTGTVADPGDIVRTVGTILEPSDVAAAVMEAIDNEEFLILPHPEVADYVNVRAQHREKWLAGMRKLQLRVLGY